jgi:hypothetical protein
MMIRNSWKFKLGLSLIILSVILFVSLPVIPFLNIENTVKISLSTAIFIIAEITFWTGGLLVGKEILSKYKVYLNPKNWFNPTSRSASKDESSAH